MLTCLESTNSKLIRCGHVIPKSILLRRDAIVNPKTMLKRDPTKFPYKPIIMARGCDGDFPVIGSEILYVHYHGGMKHPIG